MSSGSPLSATFHCACDPSPMGDGELCGYHGQRVNAVVDPLLREKAVAELRAKYWERRYRSAVYGEQYRPDADEIAFEAAGLMRS